MNNISNVNLHHAGLFYNSYRKKNLKLFLSHRKEALNWPLKAPLLFHWHLQLLHCVEVLFFHLGTIISSVLSIISWVVTDTVCSCCGSAGPCYWKGAFGFTVLFSCVCTDTPWTQVGCNYWKHDGCFSDHFQLEGLADLFLSLFMVLHK